MTTPKFKLGEIVIYVFQQSVIEKAEWSRERNCWIYCLSNNGWQEERDLMKIE